MSASVPVPAHQAWCAIYAGSVSCNCGVALGASVPAPEARLRAEALLQYVEDASDGLMTPAFIHLADAATVVACIRDVVSLAALLEQQQRAQTEQREALRWLDTYLETDGRLQQFPHTTARKRITAVLAAADPAPETSSE